MNGPEDVERRLAATDFSADSRVRASLRARLLDGGRARARFSPVRAASLSLAFAALLLALALPFRSRLFPASEQRLAATVVLPAPVLAPAARRSPYPRGVHGLPVLPGFLAASGTPEPSPLSSRALDHLIDVRRGRTVRGKDRTAVVFVFGHASYRFETRRITPQDLVETNALTPDDRSE